VCFLNTRVSSGVTELFNNKSLIIINEKF